MQLYKTNIYIPNKIFDKDCICLVVNCKIAIHYYRYYFTECNFYSIMLNIVIRLEV